jgi:NADP-dependent 3-hydroxy acid dehydrogenase YdfG
MNDKLALVTGVGPGTGLSVVRRFANGGYQVAMIARSKERLQRFEAEIQGTRAYVGDVTDISQFTATLDRLCNELEEPAIVVHNAVGGVFGDFMGLSRFPCR